MKSTKRLTFLLLVCMLLSFIPALATHSAGGALTYTHLSGNIYRVHFTFYRDCFGIAAPGSFTLDVNSTTCNINQTYTMIPIPNTGNDIVLFCPSANSTCLGGNAPGMEKWEYEVDITVAGQCPDWIFSISDCCRNNAITTLQNAGADGMYIEAHLNNQNGDNSSPRFTNDPLIIVCNNQDFNYNNGAFDEDGDSIAYNLVCPLSAPNTCVLYNQGYNYLQPFSSIPPVTFDSFTGDYFMHAMAAEVSVICCQLLDYRNGELMGSVMRDIIMYTIPCTNNNPTATHMNGTSQQIAYVFPTDTICFDIFSDDPDVTDTLMMTWNQTIPAASFTTTTAIHPTGTFCWTPGMNDLRSQPYMFTCRIQDNTCPINNAQVYSYYIYVTLDSLLAGVNGDLRAPDKTFSIFPNPSDGSFSLNKIENISSIKIIDFSGKVIQAFKSEEQHITTDIPDGVYWIEIIYTDGRKSNQKLIIKN